MFFPPDLGLLRQRTPRNDMVSAMGEETYIFTNPKDKALFNAFDMVKADIHSIIDGSIGYQSVACQL